MRPIGDAEFLEEIESLTRSAALKALENETNMDGIASAQNDAEFDAAIDEAVEHEFISGMEDGSLYGITEPEFEAEVKRLVMGGGGLDGWFKKLRKKVSKVAKKVGYVVNPVTHVRAAAKLAKRVGKSTKKVAKKVFKAAKKVAPYAAAGAALYFGGPYALAALKTAGSGIMGFAKKGAKYASNIIGGGTIANAPARGIVSPAVKAAAQKQGILSPAITDIATETAKAMLSRKGINMGSPQAQQALKSYMYGEQVKLAKYQPPVLPNLPPPLPAPRPSGGMSDVLKFALPAAIVGGALMLS